MSQKDKAIEGVLKELGSKYDTQAVDLSVAGGKTRIESVPTGCISLDWVFGCGGLPRGRIIEIYGEEASGKSTMAMYLASQIQKSGGKAVWIDAEFSFDEDHARELGLDTKDLVLIQPVIAEEALDAVNKLAKTNAVDLIVLDSVAALLPKKEAEGEIDKEDMALQARLMSKSLRVIAGTLSRSKTAAVFINQVREKVGLYYGPKKTTPGGKALRFYASVRLEVKKGDNIEDKKKDVIGNVLKVRAVKNKVGRPFRETEFDLYYMSGVDQFSDLLEFAVRQGVVARAGASYSLGDEKIGTGKEAAVEALSKDKDICGKIQEALEKNSAETSVK